MKYVVNGMNRETGQMFSRTFDNKEFADKYSSYLEDRGHSNSVDPLAENDVMQFSILDNLSVVLNSDK